MPGACLHLGTLVRPHGIRGEICVDWYADTPLDFSLPLLLQAGDSCPVPVRMTGMRIHQGRPLIQLEGVNDRNAAELLRGYKLLVPRTALPEPEPDECYLADIIGAGVCLSDGRQVGKLESADLSAGQQIWTIRGLNGREILFPAVPDFVEKVDANKGLIVIRPPDGLLEIYLDVDRE